MFTSHSQTLPGISIHSLRMEGDLCFFRCHYAPEYFNPLPPYGGRLLCCISSCCRKSFQSTPSVWRETCCFCFSCFSSLNFNPLPPYGGRPYCHFFTHSIRHFNPLPPYGGRPDSLEQAESLLLFQSTPSVWRETTSVMISEMILFHFNPLPPYGGRQKPTNIYPITFIISIHSLRMEGDTVKLF